MVDGTFIQTRIQVEQLVQSVTCEQVHCHARLAVPRSTFLSASVQLQHEVCEVSERSKPL